MSQLYEIDTLKIKLYKFTFKYITFFKNENGGTVRGGLVESQDFHHCPAVMSLLPSAPVLSVQVTWGAVMRLSYLS